ncbi:MAG: universal stress protein [Ornithinimicrobium sp.]
MRPIVVGLDPADPCSEAVNWALTEARLRGLPVDLRLARGVPVSAAYDVPLDALMPEPFAQEVLQAAAAHAARREPTVQVRTHLNNGSAGAVLVAASMEAECVVVGRQSHSRIAETVVGSTSAQVAAHALCPVAVVDNQARPRRNGPVVVGVDGSSANQKAISYAFGQAQRRGVPLVGMYAWRLDLPEKVTLPWVGKESLRKLVQAQRRILYESLAGRSQEYPDVEVRHVVSRQLPVNRLEVAARSASMLVVGSRGLGGFHGLLLGSVSRGLLYRPRLCPVVVVPTRDQPSP